jgi:hypothetical protein
MKKPGAVHARLLGSLFIAVGLAQAGLEVAGHGSNGGLLGRPPHDHRAVNPLRNWTGGSDAVVRTPVAPVCVRHTISFGNLHIQRTDILETKLPVECVAGGRGLEPTRQTQAVGKVDTPL